MSDSDSDLGFFPTIIRRVKRRVSLGNHSLEVDSDEESLYETMPQKLKWVYLLVKVVILGIPNSPEFQSLFLSDSRVTTEPREQKKCQLRCWG